jgi:glutamate-ammonia-ligase adenylyltransferase
MNRRVEPTGVSLPVSSLISRLTSSGTAGSLAKAMAICRKSLLGFIDDEPVRAALAVRLESAPAVALLLARLLDGSPFLTRLMRRWPDWLAASLDADPDEHMGALLERMAAIPREAGAIEEAMAPMRRLRNEAALHIALADCAGLWPVERVTEALTAFADAATATALEVSLARLAEAGRFVPANGPPLAPQSGLTILAMGKHGAGELNYSSDIDLIVLFDPRKLPVREGLEPLDLAVQVTKDIVRLLHEPTGDGFVFRVDLRLRPDPASTPISMPIGGALA